MKLTLVTGLLGLFLATGLSACGAANDDAAPDAGAGSTAEPAVQPTVELVMVTEPAAAAPQEVPSLGEGEQVLPSGLHILDEQVGDGAEAVAGKTVSVHYTGTLVDGTKFDSSLDRGQPIEFVLGVDPMIQGWDEGIPGMKVGGKRKLGIPAAMAYADSPPTSSIPPGAVLMFSVELMDVK